MHVFNQRFYRVYVVPAAVFQSVGIGGGYGTGRELIEFFTSFGPLGGLLGMLLAALLLGIILALTYEFARRFRLYDYRSFFKNLIGRYWWLFEVLYLTLAMIALAVVASAAGKILESTFHIPPAVGVISMMIIVGIICFYGREVVQLAMTFWSAVLNGVMIVYITFAFIHYGPSLLSHFGPGDVMPGWQWGALRYALYSAPTVAVVLFAVRAISTPREAVISGFGSAALFMFPAVLFHISFMGSYPWIVEQALPVYSVLQIMNVPFLVGIYTIVLFGTLIETGAGTIQAINERIDNMALEKHGKLQSRKIHATVAVAGLGLSVALSQFGIIALVARGYGTLAWGFLVVYILPLLTLGIWKIRKDSR